MSSNSTYILHFEPHAKYFGTLSAFYDELSDKLKTLDDDTTTKIVNLFTLNPKLYENLAQVAYCSDYFRDTLIKNPQELIILGSLSKNYFAKIQWNTLLNSAKKELGINTTVDESYSNESFDKALRIFRQRAMLCIIWGNTLKLTDTFGITRLLSNFADICINQALNFYNIQCQEKYGIPTNKAGEPQQLIVLAMGKLGGQELNLSSDIDLIFCYPEKGVTNHPAHSTSNQEYFSALSKHIIRSLNTQTAEGFVFRVDMRLRPYGESGAIVSSFDALENYYQNQGRDWERFAMIKARIITPCENLDYINALLNLIKQFTYRRYIDFSVIESLRQLKQKILLDVKRRKLENNIKLGDGGIREIEFIVQGLQLIRGGRNNKLQTHSIQQALDALLLLEIIDHSIYQRLLKAYVFLRDVEHAIQSVKDEQTQTLPIIESERDQIAVSVGSSTHTLDDTYTNKNINKQDITNIDQNAIKHDDPSWPRLQATLDKHRAIVHEEFNAFIADDQQDTDIELSTAWFELWSRDSLGSIPQDTLAAMAKDCQIPLKQLKQTTHILFELQKRPSILAMQASTRPRLDQFISTLLTKLFAPDDSTRTSKTISKTTSNIDPNECLKRLNPLIESIARRSIYLVLLNENTQTIDQLIDLSSASPWIATRLADFPSLLDELLDQKSLFSLPSRGVLLDELRQTLLRIENHDLEAQMNAIRHFKLIHSLRVAACEAINSLPLMQVSNYLTFLAECILQTVLDIAWHETTAKYGFPDGCITPNNFAIVAYGKLGGIELSHDSDLDLVFLHSGSINGETHDPPTGTKPIDNPTFFLRLGQKIIHFLNTRMLTGKLYEVDMRLRPSGNSGLLVSSLDSFSKYQKESAWTWEHQALIRARVVAGSLDISAAFEKIRAQILSQPRDVTELKNDITAMRLKMREHLLNHTKNSAKHTDFALKQAPGGIVDIEFMVQYCVLAKAHQNPALTRYTDNIRILENLGQSKQLSKDKVDVLTQAYVALRSKGHSLTLQEKSHTVPYEDVQQHTQRVINIWHKLLK